MRKVLLPLIASWALTGPVSAQVTDPIISGSSGPELTIEHLFNGQWPTGIAVSAEGRKFVCYPAGLDLNNTYLGVNNNIVQVAEIVNGQEVPYPNVSYNHPPGGSIDLTKVPAKTKGDPKHLLGVQSVVIDSENTLWILDTGRVTSVANPVSVQLPSQHGGPKLISVDLQTNQVTRTIIFPIDVAYPTSYLNDVRIDNKRKFAYLTDSSAEGRNGIVIVNLKNGQSWRRLDDDPRTHAIPGVVPFVYGEPMYQITGVMKPTYVSFGADGLALSPDGTILYFSVIAGRFIYSVPTAALRNKGKGAEAATKAAVMSLGEKGISDGMETDTNGIVYAGNHEQDAISMVKPAGGLTNFTTIFVRDPRINWVDTMSIATDGKLYFTVNQLNYLPAIYPGTGLPLVDRRQRPFVLFSVPLPNGGTKITP